MPRHAVLLDNPKEISAGIRRERELKGLSRRKVVNEYNRLYGTNLSEITLYNWERGRSVPSMEAVKGIAAVLEVLPDRFRETPSLQRPLKIGIAPFHDSVFLQFVAESGTWDVGLNMPAIDVKVVPTFWFETLGRLQSGDIDLALYNVNEFEIQKLVEPESVGNIIRGKDLVEYRGYALISTPSPDLNPFRQLYADECANLQKGEFDRNMVLGRVLVRMLIQLSRIDVVTVSESDMQRVLLELVKIAKKHSSGDKDTAQLNKVGECISNSAYTELSAFLTFLDHCKNLEPAVFLGGLWQRLICEEEGAVPLLDHRDFQELAISEGYQIDEGAFGPKNALFMNKEAYDKGGRATIGDVRRRWNEAITLIERGELNFFRLNPNFMQLLVETGKELDRDLSVSPCGYPHILERVFHECMLRLLPWEE